MNNQYNEIIIGLEVHIQLTNLKTKLFCSCSNDYRSTEPNSHVCPICIGLPGSLPAVNKKAIEFAIKLALALDSKINNQFWFFRKNYFYPDLPKGFQISQYNKAGGKALGDGGIITIKLNSHKKKILLNRIHLEEDPARLVHMGSIATSPYTLVDYNRSGVTLIEIVSEPVISSPEEAREFLKQLKSIVQYTGISNLELEGSVRVDANISIKGYERVEVKNINSFKEVERALRHEIVRQKNMLKRGKKLIQETRHWDDKRRITIALRTKEFEEDYRYFPEPDLVPIEMNNDFIQKVKNELPEMPNERAVRFRKEYRLTEFDSYNLVLDKNIADFYEIGVKSAPSFGYEDYKLYCNWLMSDISRYLNDNNIGINNTNLKPEILTELIDSIKKNIITGKIAKEFVPDLMKGVDVKTLIEKTGKKRISDKDYILTIAKEIIKDNPEIVKDFEKNPRALEALIGECMKKTKGQLDPKLTREILIKLISKK